MCDCPATCALRAVMDLTACPSAAGATESPQSSGDTRGSGGHRRSNSQQGNSGSPSALAGKSFKEVHAERNKQAQRRFRQRQKVWETSALACTHCAWGAGHAMHV